MKDLYAYEQELADGRLFCGVDEAGRGPLAGPVCAAAVILPAALRLPGLNDSKKLTERKREELFGLICRHAVSYAVAYASVEEIEELNIRRATCLAMSRAVEQLSPVPELALVDGNDREPLPVPAVRIVRGDGCCASIAAASILAKVSRDRLMVRLGEEYPLYGFARHKGYGTAAHYAALREYGPSPIHRPTYLRKMH